MLPPDRIATTGPSIGPTPAMSAATAAAPDGSTSIFARSATSSSARERSSSETVRTSMWCAARMPNGTVAGRPDGDAVGHRAQLGRRDRVAGGEGRRVRGGAGGLHADHADVGPQLAPGRRRRRPRARLRRPARRSVATSGTCSTISSAIVPCPATTSSWSNGWMRIGAGAVGVLARVHQGLVDAGADQLDARAVLAGRGDLGQRGVGRHEDDGVEAEHPGRERDALRVVAGARRDDPARLLLAATAGPSARTRRAA